MFDPIEFGRGILRMTSGTLFGTATVAAVLLHSPPAIADAGGSAEQPQGTLFDWPPTEPAPSAQPLGFRGPQTAIVVLGYGLLPDGEMRPELISRLHAGYVQALLAPLSPIIVTGGNPCSGVTEAQAMADWLIGHGIPAERIHIEPEAVSTAQNAERSARIMHDIGTRDAVVVTSADHIDRAAALFGDAGIAVIATVTPEKVPPLVWEFGPRS
ncbi:YdcF family protein [Nocardia anaemiae]|uniref:YdcF family protein n=1 Tax=Nocardia anaemiae TaxID=263910 RepID=UPI0007A56312|nr:YdcF family protein [Nocardia anaemiae]